MVSLGGHKLVLGKNGWLHWIQEIKNCLKNYCQNSAIKIQFLKNKQSGNLNSKKKQEFSQVAN